MERKTKRAGVANILKEASAKTLINLLKSIPGSKDLVLDHDLISSLDYIANVNVLKQCDVGKIYKLEPGTSPGQMSRCTYLVRSSLKAAKIIADHINSNENAGKHKNYWIIFVPRKLQVCDIVLEREGVYGFVTILEFPLGFIPVDSDLLSLEINDFFPVFYLEGELTHVHTAAMSLVWLQKLCGTIPSIYGQGRCASMVVDLMKTILGETKAEACDGDSENISHLIIVDRDIDYVAVLLTQLTYEGLLDETFGIKSGKVTFGKEVTGKDQAVKIILNSSDTVFNEIRNCHFTAVFTTLKEKAKLLQKKSETGGMSLGDIKNFVTNEIKTVQQQRMYLALHIDACEVIVNQRTKGNFQEHLRTEHNLLDALKLKECQSYIEEIINRQFPALHSLRLLCLLSVTQDGLPSRDYKSYVVQFLQSHGHKHMITFQNLKRIGLFVEQVPLSLPMPVPSVTSGAAASRIAGKVAAAVASFPRRSPFKAVAKKMCLEFFLTRMDVYSVDIDSYIFLCTEVVQKIPETDEDIDLRNPKDMSYVFSGAYIPLVCKLTEQLIENDGFQKLEDITKLLPGTTINIKSQVKHSVGSTSPRISDKVGVSTPVRTVLVYILGGVTYAEIAALRYLGKTKGYQVIIATTSFISGNSLLRSLAPELPS